jgi:hypothetical protein
VTVAQDNPWVEMYTTEPLDRSKSSIVAFSLAGSSPRGVAGGNDVTIAVIRDHHNSHKASGPVRAVGARRNPADEMVDRPCGDMPDCRADLTGAPQAFMMMSCGVSSLSSLPLLSPCGFPCDMLVSRSGRPRFRRQKGARRLNGRLMR